MEFIIFYAFGLVVVCNFFLHYRVQKTLKTKYPEVWRAMGQPDQFTPSNDVILKQTIMRNYLKNKQYLSLNDPKFKKQCNFLRSFNKVSIILLIAYFVSIFFLVVY